MDKTKAVHRAQRISKVFERRNDLFSSAKWNGWRVGNLRPLYEPIILGFKPYKKTITDNILENSLGAYNQNALELYFNNSSNILKCGMDKNEGGLHPAQKPLKLMKALIELVTIEGQIILDPFAGSGTTIIAAKELNRSSIAIELQPEYCEIIKQRLGNQ